MCVFYVFWFFNALISINLSGIGMKLLVINDFEVLLLDAGDLVFMHDLLYCGILPINIITNYLEKCPSHYLALPLLIGRLFGIISEIVFLGMVEVTVQPVFWGRS